MEILYIPAWLLDHKILGRSIRHSFRYENKRTLSPARDPRQCVGLL